MAVLPGGRRLLAPLAHDPQLFPAQLDNLVQRFFQIHDVLFCVTANSFAGLGGRSVVAVTMAFFGILMIQLAVLLPPVLHFLAMLVHLQVVFQCPFAGSVSAAVSRPGELRHDPGAEHRQVVRPAAGGDVVVGDHLLVDYSTAGVPDVGPDARVGGQGAAPPLTSRSTAKVTKG
jgi:hypothetical protein